MERVKRYAVKGLIVGLTASSVTAALTLRWAVKLGELVDAVHEEAATGGWS